MKTNERSSVEFWEETQIFWGLCDQEHLVQNHVELPAVVIPGEQGNLMHSSNINLSSSQ